MGMLFEQENGNQIPGAPAQPAPSQPTMQSSVESGEISIPVNGATVEINEGLLDTLEQKIKAANIPGPDYIELKEAAENPTLVASEPEEKKRWSSAYIMMKSFNPQANLSKKKILDAVNHYIGIIRQEINTGQAELKELRLRDITKEHEECGELEKEIAKIEKQLEQKKDTLAKKKKKIEDSQAKYDHQEQVFNHTTQFVINMLEGDKQKIEQYIND